jgi:hypothetical protein
MPQPSPAVVEPMRRIIRFGSLGFLIVPVIAVVLFAVGNQPAAWGVVWGGGIPWVFFGVTAVTALRTAALDVTKLGVAVLSTWLLKMIVLLVVLAWLSNQDFFSRPIFFVTFLIATIGLLVAEALITLKTRVPYVDPS